MQPESIEIIAISALKDNYIWALINRDEQSAIIVDPGEAGVVHDFLKSQQLTLKAIFITHHHWDHTNGLQALLKKTSVPVYGPAGETVFGMTNPLNENDTVAIAGFPSFTILSIPAHTQGHIAYYSEGHVFCGDTLFAGGCGRLFEGTAAEMVDSLAKLAALPSTTKVYCAHEYTLDNLRFAQVVEPDNAAILKRVKAVNALRAKGAPSLPSTIADELATNPFLRCTEATIKKNVIKQSSITLSHPLAIFTALRKWKDNF